MKTHASTLLTTSLANPLVQKLPKFMNDYELATSLSNQPFFHIDWSTVPLVQRAMFLNQVKTTFCVTEISIRIASALQSLLWDGLLARNPCQPSQRRIVNEIAALSGNELKDLPWRSEFTGGIMIRGITGVGKSAAVNRFLSLLPTMIQHGENSSAQWIEFRQLVYLKVPMSSDGSRGGFLMNCLYEMDEVLGTDYFTRHNGKQWTVEKLLVNVLHYLALHRCGLLVIEEAQENNLSISKFSRDFLTFFLRLMNHGIPVVIIGNPLAFLELDSFIQDVSRFSEYGDFRINPIFDCKDEEWLEIWIPQLWGVSLLDQGDEAIENLAEIIWSFTAGFPRFLTRLRRESLRAAIQMNSLKLTREHIEVAWNSPPMRGVQEFIETFTSRDVNKLEKFKDLPIDQIRSRWKQVNLSSSSCSSTSNDSLRSEAPKDGPNIAAGKSVLKKNKSKNSQAVTDKSVVADDEKSCDLEAEDIRSKKFREQFLDANHS